jgi:hypothetical protein
MYVIYKRELELELKYFYSCSIRPIPADYSFSFNTLLPVSVFITVFTDTFFVHDIISKSGDEADFSYQ